MSYAIHYNTDADLGTYILVSLLKQTRGLRPAFSANRATC
jgi:hypothetical protein